MSLHQHSCVAQKRKGRLALPRFTIGIPNIRQEQRADKRHTRPWDERDEAPARAVAERFGHKRLHLGREPLMLWMEVIHVARSVTSDAASAGVEADNQLCKLALIRTSTYRRILSMVISHKGSGSLKT
ncbi:hypothetical protein A0H81_02222 [Grifola frondosa]|uniref:Uncharacterized protein n=1 Tax=Grifola frondosa TaxID=5627 RepID=A0A1C7MMZ8_GRIFR|nr:hypothetical protein A0H81_02222 [Grifola frondosa]